MAARAALCRGPGGRRLQARALRRRRRRPQPRPLCGSAAAVAPSVLSLSALRPSRPVRQSRSAPQPARTRPARAPPVPARVSASPPLGSAPPSARPGATAAAAPPVRSARPGRFPAPQPSASAAGRVSARGRSLLGRVGRRPPPGRAAGGSRAASRPGRRTGGPGSVRTRGPAGGSSRETPGPTRLSRSPTQRCPTPAAGTKAGATACAAAGEGPRENLEGRWGAKDLDASHPRPDGSRTETRASPGQNCSGRPKYDHKEAQEQRVVQKETKPKWKPGGQSHHRKVNQAKDQSLKNDN